MLALVLLVMSGQVAADAVEGWWQSWDSLLYVSVENGEARVFAAGILNPALVKGDLVSWSPEAPLLDLENPDPELRDRPLLGMELTENYRKKGKQWRGRLYDPRSGAWYKSHLSVVDGVLNIRGLYRHAGAKPTLLSGMIPVKFMKMPSCRVCRRCSRRLVGSFLIRETQVSPLCRRLVLKNEGVAKPRHGSYPITLGWMED